jgi:hypothetical protein
MLSMEPPATAYTPAMLARLVHAHAAFELSERLVSEVGTYAGSLGRGAFLTEQAATAVAETHALLEAAVTADRLRGASWGNVAETLDTSLEDARERFAPAEYEFRDALLFPHRCSENGGLGTTA